MNEAEFRRLNPLTIVVEFARVIGRLIVPLVILLFGTRDQTELIAQAIGGFAVISAVVRYLSFSFAIHEGNLILRSGVFVKNVRTIPLEKIQNINIRKSVVHRLLGLVDLKIETASGGGAEAALSALSVADAERLKDELSGAAHAPVQHEALRDVVYRASTKELIIAGATENKALAIVASVMGFSYLFQRQFDELIARVMPQNGGSWVMITIVAFVLILVGWLFSIASTLVAYGGFELDLQDGRIRRHYGLLNQIESVVPLRRIQALRTTQTFIQRWMDVCKLYVETAGSYQKEDIHGSSLVSPLLEAHRLPQLAQVMLPGRPLRDLVWNGISPKSIRASVQVAFLPVAVVGVAVCSFVGWVWLLVLVPVFLYQLFFAWLHFRTTGYAWIGPLFAARHGAVSKTMLFVPVERIQSLSVRQSPLQRRLGLKTAVVNTAAVGGGSSATVPHLEDEACQALSTFVHGSSVATASVHSEVL